MPAWKINSHFFYRKKFVPKIWNPIYRRNLTTFLMKSTSKCALIFYYFFDKNPKSLRTRSNCFFRECGKHTIFRDFLGIFLPCINFRINKFRKNEQILSMIINQNGLLFLGENTRKSSEFQIFREKTEKTQKSADHDTRFFTFGPKNVSFPSWKYWFRTFPRNDSFQGRFWFLITFFSFLIVFPQINYYNPQIEVLTA